MWISIVKKAKRNNEILLLLLKDKKIRQEIAMENFKLGNLLKITKYFKKPSNI